MSLQQNFFCQHFFRYIQTLQYINYIHDFNYISIFRYLCSEFMYSAIEKNLQNTCIFESHCRNSQDRRGHLKAPKFSQCCRQISEFYSSFTQISVCRHSVHWTKKASDCCQMSIFQNSQKKMFSNENSETAIFREISLRIRWYFSQIPVIKTELSTGGKDINLDKNSFNINFLQFLE